MDRTLKAFAGMEAFVLQNEDIRSQKHGGMLAILERRKANEKVSKKSPKSSKIEAKSVENGARTVENEVRDHPWGQPEAESGPGRYFR